MKYKYYKIHLKPTDRFHLPKGARYEDYGEVKDIPAVGFQVYGEVTTERPLTRKEEIYYGLWKMK